MSLKLSSNPLLTSSQSQSQSQSHLSSLLARSRSFNNRSFYLQCYRFKVMSLSQNGSSHSKMTIQIKGSVNEDVSVTEKPGSDDWAKVSAVLFDMDGVLCNSEETSRLAGVDVFAEMGVDVTVDDFVPFMGTGEANFLGGVAIVKGVADFNPEAAKKRFFEIYLEKYAKPNSGIGFPGALELITEIEKLDPATKKVTTLAGTGKAGFTDRAASSAQVYYCKEDEVSLYQSLVFEVPVKEVSPENIPQETTQTEPPYHHHHFLTNNNNPNSPITQKSLLNLLTTKCTTSLQYLKQIHALILKTNHFQDHYISGTLIKSYSFPYFNTLDSSLQVFHQVPNPNAFVWNSIMKACLDNNKFELGLLIYLNMVSSDTKTNKFTYPMLFKACMVVKCVEKGVGIHCHVVKNGFMDDMYVKSAAIQMYSSFGRLIEARMILDYGESDVVCFNAMIDGYLKCGDVESARVLFESWKKKNVGSWNAMVTGLAKCGRVEEAREVFDKMSQRDEISWSAMIDGYNKNGCFKEALEVFREMQKEKVELKRFVLSSVALACANVGSLDQGKWIHGYVRRKSIELDMVLGTALLDMYAKLGRLDLAWDVFETMKRKEICSWNAMIGALAMHGRAKDAIELFVEMEKQRVKPDEITFIGLLNACAHGGLLDAGFGYFNKMQEVYKIEPTVHHYGCMVDLLGRVGQLAEAEELISTMPMTPSAAVWGALLGACKVHGNIDIGERIGKTLINLEPQKGGRYALLSNIYAKAGRWEDVEKLRALMKDKGVKTTVGRSTIDLDGHVHEFKIGESDHPRIREIYEMVEEMITKLEVEGYVPKTNEVLFDINEDEKETTLWRHSEKLAIAFGLISTLPGTPIRVTKNLRMCEDCHSAIKLISSLYERDIVVRDRLRFHHFRNGKCSCNDFW